MELFNLGRVPWEQTQLLYHALAELDREALCLLSPEHPYVCVGFHQDIQQEVDLAFCRQNGYPVFRREVGGGAVFLDGGQLFFQLVLNRRHPAIPKGIDRFYRKFLQPVIDVHRQIGIPADYKPVNDLVVGHRKISGTGVGEIGNCVVFVGNLILNFDYDTMARVLLIPDEKFRDKVRKTIAENLTTIDRELGEAASQRPDEAALNRMLAEAFSRLLGPMQPGRIDGRLREKMAQLAEKMNGDEWLFRRGKRDSGRRVKIRAGLELVRRVHKAAGGLIRTEFAVSDGRFQDVSISGDFFCFPPNIVDRLAQAIEQAPVEDLDRVLATFYAAGDFEFPGVTVEDWKTTFRT